MRASDRDPPGRAAAESAELAVDRLAEASGRGQPHRGGRRSGRLREGQDHDEPFLGGHQDVPVAEAIQDDAFERAGGGRDRGEAPARLGEGDLMGAGQVEAEGFGSLHELAQVGVAAKQVVDEVSSQGLFLADQFAARLGMAVCEGRHRLVHDLQERFGCCPHGLVVALADDGRELGPRRGEPRTGRGRRRARRATPDSAA